MANTVICEQYIIISDVKARLQNVLTSIEDLVLRGSHEEDIYAIKALHERNFLISILVLKNHRCQQSLVLFYPGQKKQHFFNMNKLKKLTKSARYQAINRIDLRK